MTDIFSLSLEELASKIKDAQFSSVEVCEKYIERINKFEKDVKAWAHFDKKVLLEKALGEKWLKYLDQTKLLTIGPQTTKICKNIFGRVDSQAQKYTFEGLLDVAINIFN